ncbi:MAG: glutathione S-transferase family protein [Brevundimonas sp.]|jgi:glutathione S-transferase|uniref:glutathione S-transferase family protein n=1 Tax=Brevundimonas sp. TaxID=1871086 RepID=UPI00391DB467
MKLVGVYVSPFVRRVAIALNLYGITYEHVAASVVDSREAVTSFNPLGRMPSLELDDGTVLVDSHQILADLDRQIGPENMMLPAPAAAREYGQMIALTTGALEKFVAMFYETSRRPAEKVWPDWAQLCTRQAFSGVSEAERRAEPNVLEGGFLFGERITHADVAAVLAFEFAQRVGGAGVTAASHPRLSALAGRLSMSPAFLTTRP